MVSKIIFFRILLQLGRFSPLQWIFLALTSICLSNQAYGHRQDDYTEYWQSLFKSVPTKGPVKFALFSELRSRDQFDGLRFIMVSAQLAYPVNEYLTTEAHYTYIHSKPVVPNMIWRWQQRLELEANITFLLCKKMQLKTRNRLEIRKLKDLPQIRFRFRQRTMLSIPVENMWRIKEFSIYNELFYDFFNKLFEQNRFYPWQITIELSEKSSLEAYLLWQVFFENKAWRRNYTIGTRLLF